MAHAFPMNNLELFTILTPVYAPDPYDSEGTIETGVRESFEAWGFFNLANSRENITAPNIRTTSSGEIVFPSLDIGVAVGDLIEDSHARRWRVDGVPARDVNPFTGWAPTTVCHVTLIEG